MSQLAIRIGYGSAEIRSHQCPTMTTAHARAYRSRVQARSLGCSTLPFTHLPLAEVIVKIGEAGFTCWELPIRGDGVHLGHLDPGAFAEDAHYRRQLQGACTMHGAPQLLSAGFEIDRRSPLARELVQFRACAPFVKDLGGRFITVFAFEDGAAPRNDRLLALTEAAAEVGLELLIETHRRTSTQDPKQALELAQRGHALTLDHSHYVSQGLPPASFASLRRHGKLLQLRGCAQGAVEAPVETREEREAAQDWWAWLQEDAAADVPVVIEHIDRQRDWWPSIHFWRDLVK